MEIIEVCQVEMISGKTQSKPYKQFSLNISFHHKLQEYKESNVSLTLQLPELV